MASRMFGQVGHLFHASHMTHTLQHPYGTNGTHARHIGNDSIDVTLMGCVSRFNTVACVRIGLMTLLVLVTAVLCVVKLCRLHITRYPTKHQYIIFYCAALQCVLCAVHWILGEYNQLEFLIQWLKLVQLLVVSHLYWVIATRVNRKEFLTNRVLIPVYLLSLLYFTIVVVLGCVYIQETWVECYQPYWIALSTLEVVLVQLFLVAGVYITKRLNEISTLDSVRREQKRDLWLLVIFFEMSAVCGFLYDVTLKVLSDETIGCSGVFNHTQEIYTPIYGGFMMVKYLLPIWAMLIVFHPVTGSGERDELLPQASDESGYTSVFAPPFDRHRYRQISYAGVDFTSNSPCTEIQGTSSSSSSSTEVLGGPARKAKNLSTISEESSAAPEDLSVDVSDKKPIC